MVLLALALALTAKPGALDGVVRIKHLSHADHVKQKTHWDKTESVAGWELDVYRFPFKGGETPVQEVALPKSGRFQVALAPGRYFVTLDKSMNAGAFSRVPNATVSIRSGKAAHIKMTLREEYF